MKKSESISMSKPGFKDRTEVKTRTSFKNPWSFEAPLYDQRSGIFVSAGETFGVGTRQPTGKERASNTGAIPTGRPHTLKIDQEA